MKRVRQENAIKRLEKTLTLHEANTELTQRILQDKKLTKTDEEIEKIRAKKIERTKTTIANTKARLK
jgi:hypothetical protein|tara:strand:+ start:424 stop:624 length:201 start_codon:yes stop_codon:yes gene_type:complete